jgi:hypothetical protein
MESLIKKTSEQIKQQMFVWFLRYYNKNIDDFSGTEQFTLFDKIPVAEKEFYLGKLDLEHSELPVFILVVRDNEVIINTTHKFIRLKDNLIETVNYLDFEYHKGFTNFRITQNDKAETISVKTNGYISEFRLGKINREIIYWDIPTGSLGFAFWNVTKKCELIGRKYEYA